MRLLDCHNFHDFRKLAQKRLPSPIFHYIDGAAEDETTYTRNTASFEKCDLVPNVLRGVENLDLSVEVLGQKLLQLLLIMVVLQMALYSLLVEVFQSQIFLV